MNPENLTPYHEPLNRQLTPTKANQIKPNQIQSSEIKSNEIKQDPTAVEGDPEYEAQVAAYKQSLKVQEQVAIPTLTPKPAAM